MTQQKKSTKKPDLKLVNSGSVKPQALEEKAQKKIEAKTALCKEFDCSDRAQVTGYCRLHFLKLVTKKSASAKAREEDKAEDSPKRKWDRRQNSRTLGLDTLEDSTNHVARDEMIQHLGALDDDFGPILESEELNPFKKAG